jgi:putative sterol carrier protein
MTAPTVKFFDNLSRRGHEPLLEKVSATVRFDIIDGERTEHRLATIDHGDIRVSAEKAPADCEIGGDRHVFDAIFDGRISAMAALLRGELTVDGDPELLVLAGRLFPGPPAGSSGREAAGSSGRGASAGGRRSS